MTLKYDLYLYYDPLDNSVKGSDNSGWAENFLRFLRIMLRQFLGREPVILDPKSSEFNAQLLSQVKTLLFIISPDTVNSPSLHKLIGEFQNISNSQSIGSAHTNRIFKIVKFPVALNQQPSDLMALLPFDLYDYDPNSGKTREINNFFSQEAEMNFWMKLVDLAYDINETISHIDDRISIGKSDSIKRSVFLAETSPELIVQRNMIKRELLRQGYQVHPDKNLSLDSATLSEEVIEILKKCNYSIHLMGDHVATTGGISYPEIQNSAVSKFISNSQNNASEGFSRLIWLSPNFKVKDDRQQAFLENMRRDLEEVGHTEIFQTAFEDFKFILKNTLIDVSEFDIRVKSAESTSSNKSVYLIYDKADQEKATSLAGYIKGKGVRILEPSFIGNLMDIRQLHIQNLIDFDGVMIYAAHVNEFWVKMKLLDILKSPGFGRMKSLDKKSVFIESGGQINKDSFHSYEVNIFEGTGSQFGIVDEFIKNL